MIFTLALRGFSRQTNYVSCVLLISILCSIFYWCFSQVLASFGEFISIAYYFVIEFFLLCWPVFPLEWYQSSLVKGLFFYLLE